MKNQRQFVGAECSRFAHRGMSVVLCCHVFGFHERAKSAQFLSLIFFILFGVAEYSITLICIKGLS